jgi:two-component system chemotaxis response regulator CheY
MNCIILEKNTDIRDGLATVLLSMGIKGVPVASREEALSVIKEDSEISSAILDVDNKDLEALELLKELRENADTKHIKVIIHTVQSNREYVVQMVEMGVHGYLLKPFQPDTTFKKLHSILIGEGAEQKEQRQHIRVNPDPNELLRLHFKLPHLSNLVSGKIRNISMGGLALELLKPPAEGSIQNGTRIPKLEFTLNSQPLSPTGTAVLMKGNILAVRFEALTEADKNNLARYIYKRLSVPEPQPEEQS